MKTNINTFKLFAMLVAVIAIIHVASVSAFPAPPNPPQNDVAGLINVTPGFQSKGGTPQNNVTLDVAGTMSGDNLATWNNVRVLNGYVKVLHLNPSNEVLGVCSDPTGKLTACSSGHAANE